VVKVVNIHRADPEAYNVYIGRPIHFKGELPNRQLKLQDGSELCNPIKISEDCSRDEAIEQYSKYFYENLEKFKELLGSIERQAQGQTVCLVCWCKPKNCHGDVIAEYINNKISGPVPEIVTENLFED
jgi:hypothetical protein